MKNPFHVLRMHRKRTLLTQLDVAYLLNLKDNSPLSKCEGGDRPPSVDVVLAYHLLFNTQLGDLFVTRRSQIKNRISSRINPLIARLEQEPASNKVAERISCLKEVLARLTDGNS